MINQQVRPVIVGESNPFGGDEYYALYDEPEGCTGDRLCRMVMGLRSETYRRSFERRNLLRGDRWSAPRGRDAATVLSNELSDERVWILLGRKVSAAFFIDRGYWPPPALLGERDFWPEHCPVIGGIRFNRASKILILPHPSGLNRMWADRMLAGRCRYLLQSVLPEIPFGELGISEALKDFNQQEI